MPDEEGASEVEPVEIPGTLEVQAARLAPAKPSRTILRVTRTINSPVFLVLIKSPVLPLRCLKLTISLLSYQLYNSRFCQKIKQTLFMHAMFLQETSRFQLYRFTETVNSVLTEGISQKDVQLGTLYRLMRCRFLCCSVLRRAVMSHFTLLLWQKSDAHSPNGRFFAIA